MRYQRIAAVIAVVLFVAPIAVFAQDDGQFCVRTFEDRDGNGQRAATESGLTGGIGANLLNTDGIVIGSALLDDSPTANQGIICFQFLSSGQYSLVVTSADYNATTPDTLTAFVTAGSPAVVMDFGAQRIGATYEVNVDDVGAVDTDVALERLGISALAGGAAFAFMVLVGLLIYLIGFRGRLRRAEDDAGYDSYQRPTGEHPIPTSTDTGQFRRP